MLQKPDNLYVKEFIDKNGEQRIIFHANNDFYNVQPKRMYIKKLFDEKCVFTMEKEHFIVPKRKK